MNALYVITFILLCELFTHGVTGSPIPVAQAHQLSKRAAPRLPSTGPRLPPVPVCNSDQVDELPQQCVTFKATGLCNSTSGDVQDFMLENCYVTCGNCRIPTASTGNITVTVVVFSGRPDPQWVITENDRQYNNIRRLLGHALFSGFIYRHQDMPSRLGYKGILLKFTTLEYFVVGPQTRSLQQLILGTMPQKGIRAAVLAEVHSDGVLPDMTPKKMDGIGSLFNSATTRRTNNCYNYANDEITNNFAQPGRGGGAVFGTLTGASIKAAAVLDGLVVLSPQPAPSSPIPLPSTNAGHLTALFVNTGNGPWPGDFHWVRMDSTGRWSHKPGQSHATNLDQNKNPITDPRKANMGNYAFISFLTSNKTVVNIANDTIVSFQNDGLNVPKNGLILFTCHRTNRMNKDNANDKSKSSASAGVCDPD
ncbi:Insoluble matrix shell protein 1 [Acropora cervicornis]|uniref:Insoluble matrix shell protein 1 n=1 Tax=Acropora cervicornis TaxID=6130 RepID=A0AAD9VHX6_ACRCE|nr:Insoluble matrix shell protein 1 [Acropora cervicornis]